MVTLSVITPTNGDDHFKEMMLSLLYQHWIEGDEWLVVGDGPQEKIKELIDTITADEPRVGYWEVGPTGDYGNAQRNSAIEAAIGTHLVFMDDDDEFTPGAIRTIRSAIEKAPDLPILFRMLYRDGTFLWKQKVVGAGHVGTPMFVVPNQKEKLATFTHGPVSDFDFIRGTWEKFGNRVLWDEAVICQVKGDQQGKTMWVTREECGWTPPTS